MEEEVGIGQVILGLSSEQVKCNELCVGIRSVL